MKMIKRFHILLLMPILSLLVGCGAQLSTEWRIAFYNPEASRTEFVMDYKEWPIRTYIWYEWLEKDRASIYMTYHAQSEYLTTAYEKRKIFISEYRPLLKKCVEDRGWIRKEYKHGDGAIYLLFRTQDF
jgi:hypothetical protein